MLFLFTKHWATRISGTIIRVLVCAIVVTLSTFPASAQTDPGTAPSGPIQYVSNSQFNQMIQSGELKRSGPLVRAEQDLQRFLRDLENQVVVDEFIRRNPNLKGFAELVAMTPSDPNVFHTRDGNYRAEVPNTLGISRTIETMGQDTKLSILASSIRAATDPARQLALYRSLYSQYTAVFNQFCAAAINPNPAAFEPPDPCLKLTSPNALTDPATLENSSMEGIQSALASVGSLALNVLKVVPIPSSVLNCLGVPDGASSVADNRLFGDQTNSFGCGTPSAAGILKNFNWVNK
ncbi:MAG: hypothetical protein WBW33_25680, partial [Bryobacteraceae bacterium]